MPEDWMYGERSKLWSDTLQTRRDKQEVKQADLCFLFLCMFFGSVVRQFSKYSDWKDLTELDVWHC